MSEAWRQGLNILSVEEKQKLLCEKAFRRALELGYVKTRGEYMTAVKGWPTNPFGPAPRRKK